MYSVLTDTHQYLKLSSCHSPRITKNLPSSVISRIQSSDNVENDQIFKDTLIEYKAYLMKFGYTEEHIDNIFVPFSVRKKRNQLLFPSTKRNKKKANKNFRKYQMVVDCEHTFPDVRVAFRKFRSIIEDDDELKKVLLKVSSTCKYQRGEQRT